MGVLPEARRKGVGTAIFSNLITLGKKLGCKTFLLYASKFGEPIYYKYGFRSNYNTTEYSLPDNISESQVLNQDVEIVKQLPEWAVEIDKIAMGFDTI